MKKKIFIAITYIKESGGISTACANLLNEISDKYDITLCVLTNYISVRHALPSNINIIKGSKYLRDIVCSRKQLNHQSRFQKIIRNSRRIINRYLLKDKGIENALKSIPIQGEYDIAIAFGNFEYDVSGKKSYEYYFILNKVKANFKIAWIHSDAEKMGWTHELCLKRLGSFDAIVNVSNYCKSVFDRICPELRDKSFSVINTYNVEEIKQKGQILTNLYNNSNEIHLVTVSRVEIKFKRTDRIVEVCRRLVSEGYSNFDWTVVGDGGAFKILSDKVKEYDLDGVLDFVGHKDNPYPYMAQADAFILCSDYEGYPMTIKESQILETPTFITGFGSAAEIVANYQQGEICENSTEGLFEMVKSILDNPEKLKSYRKTLAQAPVTNQEAIRQFSLLIK